MNEDLFSYHCKFPGGARWRVVREGVEVEGQGLVKYDGAMYSRAVALCGKHAQAIADASVEYGVPAELLMACALTESAVKNPETCVREEPGYGRRGDAKRTVWSGSSAAGECSSWVIHL